VPSIVRRGLTNISKVHCSCTCTIIM
jgi:hypothetical protein